MKILRAFVAITAVALTAAGLWWTTRQYAGAQNPSCPASAPSDGLARFLAPDGLVYVPQLDEDVKASLSGTAYTTLAMAALGEPHRVSLDRNGVLRQTTSDLATSPIWSRWYLSVIAPTSLGSMLEQGDAEALDSFLRPDGYYDDTPPGSPPAELSRKIASTWAALWIEQLVRGDSYLATLSPTRRWLEGVPRTALAHPYIAALVASSLHRLGAPRVSWAGSVAGAWWESLRTGPAVDYSEIAHDLYGFAQLLVESGAKPPTGATTYLAPLVRRAAESMDPQLRYYVVVGWLGIGGAKRDLSDVAQKMRSSLRKDGLAREAAVMVGTLDATYYAQEIRQKWAENTCSQAVASGLENAARQGWAAWDPLTRGMWLAAQKSTVGVMDEPRRREVLLDLLEQQPSQPTPQTARRWSIGAELVQKLGGRVPELRSFTPWRLTDRLTVTAAATVVNGLVEQRRPVDALAKAWRPGLQHALATASSAPTVYEYLDTLRAFDSLGGAITPQMEREARARVRTATGCSADGRLMRTAGHVGGCDLRATLALAEARERFGFLR